MYKSAKAIVEYSIALLAGSNEINHWYKRPSIWLAKIFFGYKNMGSFKRMPKMRSMATLPGDFCLNIAITSQCY
jgi:hypothetical protein